MRALSTKTELFDPYRAGYALGENLAALAPEVVFLYSSIHYATPELLEGLYDGLGSDKAIIIGNTGGGIYETTGFAAQGAAALGLNSDGQVRWKLLCIEHADRNLSDKLEHALATLPSDGEQPCLAYLAIDFQINAQELEQFMQKNIPYPVIGGMGNRGFSTGTHLHFEIHPDGTTPVDPVAWFLQRGLDVITGGSL